jgi:hypothetical protein
MRREDAIREEKKRIEKNREGRGRRESASSHAITSILRGAHPIFSGSFVSTRSL